MPRAARLSTPLPPSASLSSGGHSAASSTSSWSRNGVRASSPWAIVMLSTRLTGSSTSITSASRRSPRSIALAAGARVRVEPVLAGLEQRRVPVVAPEDLVGALSGLHHLAVPGHLLREQEEGDRVMGDHRLAHGRDRARQRRQQARRLDPE